MATARRHSEGFPPVENPDFRTTRRWSLLRWCAEKRNFFFLHGESSERAHTHTLKLFFLLLLFLYFTPLCFASTLARTKTAALSLGEKSTDLPVCGGAKFSSAARHERRATTRLGRSGHSGMKECGVFLAVLRGHEHRCSAGRLGKVI